MVEAFSFHKRTVPRSARRQTVGAYIFNILSFIYHSFNIRTGETTRVVKSIYMVLKGENPGNESGANVDLSATILGFVFLIQYLDLDLDTSIPS